MSASKVTGRDVRKQVRIWPTSRIFMHLRMTRETLTVRDFDGGGWALPRVINRGFCWASIGVYRAELLRRGVIGR